MEIKHGDLIKLGNNYLFCGDSTEERSYESVFNFLRIGKPRLVLTDPPYGVNYATEKGKVLNDDSIDFLPKFFSAMKPWLEDYCSIYVFMAGINLCEAGIEFKKFYNLSSILTWYKKSKVLSWLDYKNNSEFCLYGWNKSHYWYGNDAQGSVIYFENVKKMKWHPTQKPIDLLRYFICNSSKLGEIVFDPFAGGGGTLIASELCKRRSINFELSPTFCERIVLRWEQLTKGTAIKLEDFKLKDYG